jgi:hypothetical protein
MIPKLVMYVLTLLATCQAAMLTFIDDSNLLHAK